MRLGDIFSQVRFFTVDSAQPYRVADADLYRCLNIALRELRRLRPDAFISDIATTVQFDPQDGVAAVDDQRELFLDVVFMNPIINYVTGLVELIEDEYASDGRAAMLLTAFSKSLRGR